jgi:hypothetical protein
VELLLLFLSENFTRKEIISEDRYELRIIIIYHAKIAICLNEYHGLTTNSNGRGGRSEAEKTAKFWRSNN